MDSILSCLKKELSKEEDFCIPNQKKVDSLKTLLKSIYDTSSSSTKRNFGPLPTLIVDGLDEESIWEELQTRTKPLARFIEKKTKVLGRKFDQKQQKLLKSTSAYKNAKKRSQSRGDDESSMDETEGSGSEDMSMDEDQLDSDAELDDVDDVEEEEDMMEGEEDASEDDDDEEEHGEDAEDDRENVPSNFKEDVNMEAWLDAFEEMEYAHKEKMEKKEKRAKASTVESREWEDEEEEEDDLEFVENALYASSDDDDDFDPKTLKYNDFFVDDGKSSSNKGGRSRSRNDEVDGDGDDDENDDSEEDDEDDDDFDFGGGDDYVDSEEDEDAEEEDEQQKQKVQKQQSGQFVSSYERRTKELANQIAELEKELVAEKSWELKGEVKSGIRPENSLLDVAADVERSTKIAPVITQEYTTTLEDRIIERIKASRYDDPAPRNSIHSNVIDGDEPNGDNELSQEKSKVGLGELYAEEYAKQVQSSTQDVLTVQTQALHEEAINLYNEVSRQLDALTHFFFTPKPVATEASAKVLATQRSMPALEMEDITPFSQNSTALAVAPEQLLEKKRGKKVTLLTSAELTSEDRKKLRRHKKAVQKAKKASEPVGAPTSRREADKKLTDELKADKRVVFAGGDSKDTSHKDSNQFAKSAVFFSKLQEEAKQQIGKSGSHSGNKRKRDSSNDNGSAGQYKL